MKSKTEKKKLKPSVSILYGMEFEFQHVHDGTSHEDGDEQQEDEDALEKAIQSANSELDASNRDGGGVEAVGEPHSFEWYMANKDWFNFLDVVKANDKFKGDNSNHAGIHIHVDRSMFSVKSFLVFIEFLKTCQNILHVVSGRGKRKAYTNVCTECGKNRQPFAKRFLESFKDAFQDPDETYGNDCLYLNDHGNGTIECRFFNATTDKNKAIAYLQFVRAICYFCKSQREKTSEQFLVYIKDYKLRYPELVEYMKKINLLTDKLLAPTAHAKTLY